MSVKERKERKRSVFMRYALSYTLVVLVLFSGVAFYVYNLTISQVRRNIVDAQINRLTRIAIQHESYISSMLNTAEEIGLSPHIEAFRYDEEPWKAYDLQLQLVPYTATNSFCDQVYLHFSGDDRIYSSSSSMTVEMFSELMRCERLSAAEMTKLIRKTDQLTILPAQKITSNLIDGNEPRVIFFLVPLGANPGTSKGTMLFLVKESAYQNMFADAIDGHMNTYVFSGGQVLAGAEDLPMSPERMAELSRAGEEQVFHEDGKAYLKVALGEKSWGLRYVTVLSMDDVNSTIQGSLRSTLAILLAIAALGLGLAFWMARHHAKPIEDISEMLSGNDPERRDELQRISTGIQKLTQNNHELISRLDSAIPMQRHDFVFRFIKGRFASREDAVAAGRAVRMDIDRPWYAVILCSVPEEWDRPFELSQPPFDVFSGLAGAGVELVAMKANLYLVFSGEPEQLSALAEEIRKKTLEGGGQCVTAISAAHNAFEEAPTAYLEAAAAYDNRFAMGDTQVLAYDDISSDVADILPKAQTLTNGISQAIRLGSREMLDDRISELLHFLKNTRMSPFAFRMIYNNVIDTLTRAQAAEFSAGRDARDMYDIFTLSSCQSINDLDELLRRLCDTLLSDAEQKSRETAEGEEDVIILAARYMDEHFSDPEISMAAIAESFDLSTTRFSLSFKERMGMTPLDYLTLLRSARARELLEETDLTIREIGAQVGYYDSGSFIRRFKQVTGMTPLQYRHNRSGDNRPEDGKRGEEA